MRVLLLSAYDTPSHRGWCLGLQRHLPEREWTYLTLPARHFPWRIRGNPLSWSAFSHQELACSHDVLLATSMVDLATLCGLYPHLGRARKVLYFHENQFAYPLARPEKGGLLEPRTVTLYAALAADDVVFNSEYNRTTFLQGAREHLKRMPDLSPPSIVRRVEEKARVLPVPVSGPGEHSGAGERIGGSLVWNHRWEHDKNPGDFFRACSLLSSRGVPFRLIVMGQQFRRQPPEFEQAARELRDRILCWGEQPEDAYRRWLGRGQWVVSTARHEFQGVAVMEAVRAGCVPAVPDRLSYPEFFSRRYRYGETAEELADFLQERLAGDGPAPPDLEGLSWERLAPQYERLLQPAEGRGR
jgi:glycosyltransferase involved in cell wall biosynthesis